MSKHYTPNDMRSMAMNSNNPAHAAAEKNHAEQLNPTAPAYKAAMDNKSVQMNSKDSANK